MNINATLFGQMITFAIFVWFTWKFVWPYIIKALDERQQKIADGLEAAERGQKSLEEAQVKIAEQLKETKVQAATIIDNANTQAAQLIEESREKAKVEGERLIKSARDEINREVQSAKLALRQQVSTLAITSAEKIIGNELDQAANDKLVAKLIEEI